MKVRFLREVTQPQHLAGAVGDERELADWYGARLIADGYCELAPAADVQAPVPERKEAHEPEGSDPQR